MRTGGYSHFGGTALFGGGPDAEERFYDLLLRWLGDGAFEKDEEDVRSRVLMCFARMLATAENEAIKQAFESVPRMSISQMSEWQAVFVMKYLEGVYGDTWLAQQFMAMIMRFTCNTPNIKRLAIEVARIMDAAFPTLSGGGGLGVTGFENTEATAISDDGVRYFCILVPATVGIGYGSILASKAHRPLYRAIKHVLGLVSPAHTVPALCTSDDGAGTAPAWYSDGYLGTGFDKDCVGS